MFGDSDVCIVSPEDRFGISPSISRDGETPKSGLEVALANPSVLPVRVRARKISDTSGRSGSGLSGSVDLPSSSASRSALPQAEKLIRSKVCNACGTEKLYDEFYTNSKGQRPGTCKSCMQAQERHRKSGRQEEMAGKHHAWREKRRGYALVNVARFRAKSKGLPCTLDPENIQMRIDRGRCEVTAIPFDLTTPRAWN